MRLRSQVVDYVRAGSGELLGHGLQIIAYEKNVADGEMMYDSGPTDMSREDLLKIGREFVDTLHKKMAERGLHRTVS